MTSNDLSLAPYDILIVDDSNAILSHVLNTLNSPEFRCRVARTAQSGLEAIRTRLPDLLLLDCQLDGSHKGSEVLAACPSPHAPVTIVFSASAEEADTLFHGFEQVSSRILKPFSTEELRAHVREALEENADTIAAIREAMAAVEQVQPLVAASPLPAPPEFLVTEPSSTTRTRTGLEPAAETGQEGGPVYLSAETDDALLQSFLGSPALQRELAHSLRKLLGLATNPLAAGPSDLLPASQALRWALQQPHMMAVTQRDPHEVIEVYLAGYRILGVASDAWGGARGKPAPPDGDPDGALQRGALHRLSERREEARVEVRELEALPVWTLRQPTEVLALLAAWEAEG